MEDINAYDSVRPFPLFRTSIGFDRMSRLLDSAARIEDNALSYPPYNIEQVGEHKYSITMALAGFSEEDLDLQVHKGTLAMALSPASSELRLWPPSLITDNNSLFAQ